MRSFPSARLGSSKQTRSLQAPKPAGATLHGAIPSGFTGPLRNDTTGFMRTRLIEPPQPSLNCFTDNTSTARNAAAVRLPTPSLSNTSPANFFTVASRFPKMAAISELVFP